MADRHTLHFSHLPKLEQWLCSQGYHILPLSNNCFEVLRAKKEKNTIIIYRKTNAKEHLSIMDKDIYLINRFLHDMRGDSNEN